MTMETLGNFFVMMIFIVGIIFLVLTALALIIAGMKAIINLLFEDGQKKESAVIVNERPLICIPTEHGLLKVPDTGDVRRLMDMADVAGYFGDEK